MCDSRQAILWDPDSFRVIPNLPCLGWFVLPPLGKQAWGLGMVVWTSCTPVLVSRRDPGQGGLVGKSSRNSFPGRREASTSRPPGVEPPGEEARSLQELCSLVVNSGWLTESLEVSSVQTNPDLTALLASI